MTCAHFLKINIYDRNASFKNSRDLPHFHENFIRRKYYQRMNYVLLDIISRQLPAGYQFNSIIFRGRIFKLHLLLSFSIYRQIRSRMCGRKFGERFPFQIHQSFCVYPQINYIGFQVVRKNVIFSSWRIEPTLEVWQFMKVNLYYESSCCRWLEKFLSFFKFRFNLFQRVVRLQFHPSWILPISFLFNRHSSGGV